MKALPCYVTEVIVDAFCEFLLSRYIQEKLSSFNPTSEVSHMQQNNLVYIIPSGPPERIKKDKVLMRSVVYI